MRSTEPTIAVVVLNWNGGEEILRCLESVTRSSYTSLAIVIVDNGSVDGSTDVVVAKFPQVHVVHNPTNLGFAKGCNQGMEWALQHGIRYVLLLNGDARLHPEAMRELFIAARAEHDDVVTSPRMYLADGSAEKSRLWFAYGTVMLWAGLFQNPAFNQPDGARWSTPRDMGFGSGCCLLIPAKILDEVGLLDESFFAYCEDIDFSLRVRKAGFRMRYVPEARLWHGSHTPTNRARTSMYRYLATRNNLWVVRKHGSLLEFLTCFCILPMRSLFRISRMLLRREWHGIYAELRGIKDGLFARLAPAPPGEFKPQQSYDAYV